VGGEPLDQDAANERTRKEPEERGDRGRQGESRHTGQREPDEDDVARHVGHEDAAKAEDADGVDESGHRGQHEQQGR
jgi:hypothetical protein